MITPVFRPTKQVSSAGNMVRVPLNENKIWYKIYPNCWTTTKEQANCTHKSIWIFMTSKSWYFLQINQRDTTMCNICIANVPLFQFWLWYGQYWYWWHIGKSNDGTEKEWHTFQFLHCYYWQYAKTQTLLLAICQNTKKLGDATAISKSETINAPLTHWLTGVGARRCYRI